MGTNQIPHPKQDKNTETNRRHFMEYATGLAVSTVIAGLGYDIVRQVRNDFFHLDAQHLFGLECAKCIASDTAPVDSLNTLVLIKNGNVFLLPPQELNEHPFTKDYLTSRKNRPAPDLDQAVDSAWKRLDGNAIGSGTILKLGNSNYLCSVEHLLSNAPEKLEKHMLLNGFYDIGLAPLRLTKNLSKHTPLRRLNFSENLRDTDLPGRKVRITGLGARFYDISGTVIELPESATNGFVAGHYTKKESFALKLSGDDIGPWYNIMGLSGSPVVDCATNEMLGLVFFGFPLSHLDTGSNHNTNDILLIFRSIDTTRKCLQTWS